MSFNFVCSPCFGLELSSALAPYEDADQFFIASSFQRFRHLHGGRRSDLRSRVWKIDANPNRPKDKRHAAE